MDHLVMLVDDSEPDLLYTRIMLERSGRGWEVLAFEEARTALAWLQSPDARPVRLILLDINMPGMNGFEFLAAYDGLRASQRAGAVVVMLTSSPDPSDRARAFSFEAVRGYVTKPIEPDAVQGLERHLA